jgi:steroid 5-alpha reductase family enzyme
MTYAPTLLWTLGAALAVQAVFFIFAAAFKTDKVTDLSYGLSFVILAVALLIEARGGTVPQLVLSLMVVLWGARLAAYLLYRIVRMKRDPRFDGVRERFWAFAKFWLLQGVAVWVIMLPVTLWFVRPGPGSWRMVAGFLVWLAGLVIESTADLQKFREKSRPGGASRWVSRGLWRYSRHPNYFGELLCWWGVFVFVAGDLSGWSWLGVAGPLAITALLLFVTGIPTLEASARRKWGTDPGYAEYRRRTRLLVPLPRFRTSIRSGLEGY